MRTAGKPLDALLFGATRSRIFAVLFRKPQDEFFLRQIARETGVSAGTMQRELATLVAAELVSRNKVGNQVFYRANREHPIYAALHELVARTSGVFAQLAQALEPLADRIDLAFVYGSFALGLETAASDVDLMVIGDLSLDDLLEHITPVEAQLSRPVNPTIYSHKEWTSRLASGNHFVNSVMKKDMVFLIGTAHELAELR